MSARKERPTTAAERRIITAAMAYTRAVEASIKALRAHAENDTDATWSARERTNYAAIDAGDRFHAAVRAEREGRKNGNG